MKKFSLMELLVVMGIILLMMSLLLPAVGPMMNRAEINRIASTIAGQLEVGYIKSLENSSVVRVSFEYDPVGKNVTWDNLLDITGTKPTGADSELAVRQMPEYDLNCDGIPGGEVNRQMFWIKGYLCSEDTIGDNAIASGQLSRTVAEIRKLLPTQTSAIPNDCVGPVWIRRPLSRVQDSGGKFLNLKMLVKPTKDKNGDTWYFRPVANGPIASDATERLLPIAVADNTCILINEGSGFAKVNRDLDRDGQQALPDGDATIVVFNSSVALFKTKGGPRYQYSVGKTASDNALAALIALNPTAIPLPTKADLDNPSTEWYDIFEGDVVNPENLNFGMNDDEDKLIDEGMSVSVESYRQSVDATSVELDFAPPMILHNNYFSNIEDNNEKIGREYFIGGKDRKGVMLRRIWAAKGGAKVLVWSVDKILGTPAAPFALLKKSTPYYFSVVFDIKNGSGMYICNSFGAVQAPALYFQICDDDNKITTMIELKDGVAKVGSKEELYFLDTTPGYYQGTK